MSICKVCGKEFDSSPYMADWVSKMESNHLCDSCLFWQEKLDAHKELDEHQWCVIDGTHYIIGDEDDKSAFRGFGGDKFVIKFKDGHEVTTTNLWCQGNVPEHWREKFPDTADFDWTWKKIGSCQYLVKKQ